MQKKNVGLSNIGFNIYLKNTSLINTGLILLTVIGVITLSVQAQANNSCVRKQGNSYVVQQRCVYAGSGPGWAPAAPVASQPVAPQNYTAAGFCPAANYQPILQRNYAPSPRYAGQQYTAQQSAPYYGQPMQVQGANNQYQVQVREVAPGVYVYVSGSGGLYEANQGAQDAIKAGGNIFQPGGEDMELRTHTSPLIISPEVLAQAKPVYLIQNMPYAQAVKRQLIKYAPVIQPAPVVVAPQPNPVEEPVSDGELGLSSEFSEIEPIN